MFPLSVCPQQPNQHPRHGLQRLRRNEFPHAVKIHAAVPETEYEMVLETKDEPQDEVDIYHVEFAQKNGQWAFISPIYAVR